MAVGRKEKEFKRPAKNQYIVGNMKVTKTKVSFVATRESRKNDWEVGAEFEFNQAQTTPETWELLQKSPPKAPTTRQGVAVPGDEVQIATALDFSTLNWASPRHGTFIARYKGIPHHPDFPPKPYKVNRKEITTKDGRNFPIEAHQEYRVLLEIARLPGLAKSKKVHLEGWGVSHSFWYMWDKEYDALGGSTGNAIPHGTERKISEYLDFLDLTGMPVYSPDFYVPFSDNILPWINTWYKENGLDGDKAPVFQIRMENGFVKEFGPAPQ
jgi:hypothetical protein